MTAVRSGSNRANRARSCPETYVGFGEQAYNYNLFLQVGGYDDAASVQLTQQLPTDRYNAFLSEIYAEGNNRPFEPFLVGEGSELVQELATFWWEDNPLKSFRAELLPPLLGGTLALLSSVGAWWALRRRGGSEQPRYSPTG